jgi:hypothetical protein
MAATVAVGVEVYGDGGTVVLVGVALAMAVGFAVGVDVFEIVPATRRPVGPASYRVLSARRMLVPAGVPSMLVDRSVAEAQRSGNLGERMFLRVVALLAPAPQPGMTPALRDSESGAAPP